MEKNVLILSDFVGYGNVAMATARSVLTRMGCTVFCLPTALISNTWNFGSCAVLNTTDYLKAALENWEKLGFRLDAVLIGYLADEAQAEYIGQLCRKWHQEGVSIFLDPIFADNGKLYRGITEDRLTFLRSLLPLVDYILPNATESCFLAQTEDPAAALTALDVPNVLITGVPRENGSAVLLRTGSECTVLPYDPIPGNFPGAGDAFTALFTAHILSGRPPADSAASAIRTTRLWLLKSRPHHGIGLPVERLWEEDEME